MCSGVCIFDEIRGVWKCDGGPLARQLNYCYVSPSSNKVDDDDDDETLSRVFDIPI